MCKLKDGTDAEKEAFKRGASLIHLTGFQGELLFLGDMSPSSDQKRLLLSKMPFGDIAFADAFKKLVDSDPERFVRRPPRPKSKPLSKR